MLTRVPGRAPHDFLFKRLLRAFFPDLLQLALPDLAGYLNVQGAVFLDKELFTDSGRRREPDLLVRVPLAEGSESLLVHVEIEAHARSRIVGRLRQYRRRIEAAYDADVVSVVVTLRGGGSGLQVRALHLTPEEVSEYATSDIGGGNPTMRLTDMSWGDRLRAEGWKEGRREGVEQGAQKVAQKVLLRLLTRRFGRQPVAVRRRIEEIDSVDRLIRLAERVLTARSLEDLGLASSSGA